MNAPRDLAPLINNAAGTSPDQAAEIHRLEAQVRTLSHRRPPLSLMRIEQVYGAACAQRAKRDDFPLHVLFARALERELAGLE